LLFYQVYVIKIVGFILWITDSVYQILKKYASLRESFGLE
jgi:hypothetical protein